MSNKYKSLFVNKDIDIAVHIGQSDYTNSFSEVIGCKRNMEIWIIVYE